MILNLVIIFIVVASIFTGAKAGAVHALGRVVGGLLGFVFAKNFAPTVVGPIATFISSKWSLLIASLAIFAIVNSIVGFAFAFAGSILKIVTRLPLIKQVDGLLGGIFTLLETILVIGGVHWILIHAPTTPITYLDQAWIVTSVIDPIFSFVFSFLV